MRALVRLCVARARFAVPDTVCGTSHDNPGMNELHRALAAKILTYIRTSGMTAGEHLPEHLLGAVCGTSRAPIRAALFRLAEQGVLSRVPNKGFFIQHTRLSGVEPPRAAGMRSDEALYLKIAEDRLARVLDTRVSENALMRRYDVSRSVLRRTLTRISGEGWIEHSEGRGWSFAALIDSADAYGESYQMRQVIEPAGIRAAGFRTNSDRLAGLRRQQALVRDGGWKTLNRMELFEINAAFHEGLAAMSDNRFLLATVRQLNQLRRLVEYRQILNRNQVRGQNAEHLRILDALDQGHLDQAADLLSQHLDDAGRRKARAAVFKTPVTT